MKKFLLLLMVLAALVTVVAGCGGGTTTTAAATTATSAAGGTTSTTSATGTTTTAAPSGETVKIGVEAGFTGDMAAWAKPIGDAAQVAIDEINAAGGILGKKVEMVSEDDESTVEGGVRAAQKLVNVNHVSAIIGPESNPIMALLGFAKDNKVPIISTSGGTGGLDTVGGKGNFIYRTNASDSFIGVGESWIVLNELKVPELSIIMESTEGATSAGESFKRNYEKIGGKVLDTVVVNPNQSGYSGEMKTLYAKNPKLVYMSASQATSIAVLKERFQMRYPGDIMGSSEIQTPETVKGAGVDASKGLLTTRIVEVEGSTGWDRFVALYQKRWNGQKPAPGYYQSNTYDAVILVALAMEAAKGTTGLDVDNFLTAVSDGQGTKVYSFTEGVAELKKGNKINFEGSSGPVDFNQYGNISAPAMALMKVDDSGNWIIVKTINTSALPSS